VIVDTDILIDAGRGISDAVVCLEEIEQRDTLEISVITQMELIVGCRNKAELRNVERFLARFYVITLDDRMSRVAVELVRQYRLSHDLLIADALIAATAIATGAPFVTKNHRDYRFIPKLDLRSYPQAFGSAA
jgi:predicted nucleic acid-binding protein